MPQPAAGDRHIESALTNYSALSMQNENRFVASKVCPIMRVAKQNDKYYVYSDEFFRRDTMQLRARATESAGGGFELSNAQYYCDKYALHVDITDDDRANADSVFELDSEAVMYLNHMALLKLEKQFATEIFATSTWTGSTTGGDITPSTKWSAAAGKPVKDIKEQMTSVQKKTGQRPNILVVGRDTWDKGLAENADMLDRVKHTSFGEVTTDIVARACELEKVYVADAINTTSAEGASTETTAYINTSDDALLLYVPPVMGRMTPAAAATFMWTGGGQRSLNEYGAAIKKFRLENIEADRVEINQYFDIKQVAATMGAYFDAAVS